MNDLKLFRELGFGKTTTQIQMKTEKSGQMELKP